MPRRRPVRVIPDLELATKVAAELLRALQDDDRSRSHQLNQKLRRRLRRFLDPRTTPKSRNLAYDHLHDRLSVFATHGLPGLYAAGHLAPYQSKAKPRKSADPAPEPLGPPQDDHSPEKAPSGGEGSRDASAGQDFGPAADPKPLPKGWWRNDRGEPCRVLYGNRIAVMDEDGRIVRRETACWNWAGTDYEVIEVDGKPVSPERAATGAFTPGRQNNAYNPHKWRK